MNRLNCARATSEPPFIAVLLGIATCDPLHSCAANQPAQPGKKGNEKSTLITKGTPPQTTNGSKCNTETCLFLLSTTAAGCLRLTYGKCCYGCASLRARPQVCARCKPLHAGQLGTCGSGKDWDSCKTGKEISEASFGKFAASMKIESGHCACTRLRRL